MIGVLVDESDVDVGGAAFAGDGVDPAIHAFDGCGLAEAEQLAAEVSVFFHDEEDGREFGGLVEIGDVADAVFGGDVHAAFVFGVDGV